jgi:hypothetical protein
VVEVSGGGEGEMDQLPEAGILSYLYSIDYIYVPIHAQTEIPKYYSI